jgi:beta-lactamase class A
MSSRHGRHGRYSPLRHALVALGLALCLFTATAAATVVETAGAQPARAQAVAVATAQPGAPAVSCVTPFPRHRALAARIARGISAALQGRVSVVALTAADTRTGITCKLHPWWPFDSASIVKVIILGALLHELAAEHRNLTPQQVTLTHQMITESSNAAATALWDEVGMGNLQHFLNLAKMSHTQLGQDGFWGLTQVVAHDELILLRLLTVRNSVLDVPSRAYALKLMAEVIPAQRWGVPAGAPTDVTVHVKNGWLPNPTLWVINSIGAFTGHHRNYRIVVLTRNNPTMTYGVDTVQGVAEVINRDLNPGVTNVIPPSAPYPSWGTPDELIPAACGSARGRPQYCR